MNAVTLGISCKSEEGVYSLSLEGVHQGLKSVNRLLVVEKFCFNECRQLQQLLRLSEKKNCNQSKLHMQKQLQSIRVIRARTIEIIYNVLTNCSRAELTKESFVTTPITTNDNAHLCASLDS